MSETNPTRVNKILSPELKAPVDGNVDVEQIPDNADLPLPHTDDVGAESELMNEDAYEESDEALPDDAEEAAITRDPEREGTRFGDS